MNCHWKFKKLKKRKNTREQWDTSKFYIEKYKKNSKTRLKTFK